MQVVIIFLLILTVLLVIFTLQNATELTIHFLFWEIKDAPLVIVLLSCLLIGYIVAAIYFKPRLWKLKREYNQLIKFNKELKELHELNNNSTAHSPEKITDPEGIELDENDDDGNTFFKD